MTGSAKLADLLRAKRVGRGWTQEQLADAARVSIDSVRRFEGGQYILPKRPRAGGHVLDKLARTLGTEPCDLIRKCFTKSETASSDYRRCHDVIAEVPQTSRSRQRTLREYVSALTVHSEDLVADAAMLNAEAIAFLITLERQFSAFEFLVTNQPPFMLFADDEYITTGSASLQLQDDDRETYHSMVFDHRAHVRDLTAKGNKHYRIVLHKQSLIAFLNARSKLRATRIVADMKKFLHYDGCDLVILEEAEPFDELEILSKNYPFRPGTDNSSLSIRHRRIGLGNTAVYQLALVGSNQELVGEDFARAEALWKRGLSQLDQYPSTYSDQQRHPYALKHKRVVSHLLDAALVNAHP